MMFTKLWPKVISEVGQRCHWGRWKGDFHIVLCICIFKILYNLNKYKLAFPPRPPHTHTYTQGVFFWRSFTGLYSHYLKASQPSENGSHPQGSLDCPQMFALINVISKASIMLEGLAACSLPQLWLLFLAALPGPPWLFFPPLWGTVSLYATLCFLL